MDLQNFVDSFEAMTCIISVEVFKEGGYGNIRIVCGNKAYVNSIENPENMAFSSMLCNRFIPDSPYEKYIPKDLNFEDTCYRCAVLKKPFHAYIQPERYSFWVDMYLMPLAIVNGDTYYCTYTQELTSNANTERMSKIPAAVSSAVLETCLKLRGSKDFRKKMDEVITDLRTLCGAEKSCILLIDRKKHECSVLCESNALGDAEGKMEEYISDSFDNFYDLVETWNDTIAGSTCLIIQNENDMEVVSERNPAWCASMREEGVKTLALYPLRHNNELLGYIWSVNFNIANTELIRNTLATTCFFLASEIANYQLLNKLEMMGSVDMLTGVMNRNAMNMTVDEFDENEENIKRSVAVVFADLNGLKQVNDNGGHDEGDKFLRKAAEILKGIFYDSRIYRAGGDEFLVLSSGISERDFEERVEKLRSYPMEDNSVSFAIGSYFSDTETDIRKAMRIADKRMYKDKEHYYERFPDRRR